MRNTTNIVWSHDGVPVVEQETVIILSEAVPLDRSLLYNRPVLGTQSVVICVAKVSARRLIVN